MQVISLASIVQKETAKVDERPRVAGVYLNRIRTNMLLQSRSNRYLCDKGENREL